MNQVGREYIRIPVNAAAYVPDGDTPAAVLYAGIAQKPVVMRDDLAVQPHVFIIIQRKGIPVKALPYSAKVHSVKPGLHCFIQFSDIFGHWPHLLKNKAEAP